MEPIRYLSGYGNGRLPPTIKPLGAGAPIPIREHYRGYSVKPEMPVLGWAIERHGMDPRVCAQEDVGE